MKVAGLLVVSAICVLGCESGDNAQERIEVAPTTCPVTVSGWSAPNFASNAKDALGLRASLDGVVKHMRDMEMELEFAGTLVLQGFLQIGTPAIATTIDSTWNHLIKDIMDEFELLVAAGPLDLVGDDLAWTPGPAGGLYGMDRRGINMGGLELRQFIDKGLYAGGGLYRYAVKLTEGPITPDTIDALAAAWGSNQTLSTEGRTDSANYSFAMGFHGPITLALTDARSYAADDRCTAERDAAVIRFFRHWEQAMVARTLFYANFAEQTLSGAQTDDARADALHEYSEGIALTFGYLHMPTVSAGPLAGHPSLLTDRVIEQVLVELGLSVHDFSAARVGAFVENPAALRLAIGKAERILAPIFGWTDADLARFRAPSPG